VIVLVCVYMCICVHIHIHSVCVCVCIYVYVNVSQTQIFLVTILLITTRQHNPTRHPVTFIPPDILSRTLGYMYSTRTPRDKIRLLLQTKGTNHAHPTTNHAHRAIPPINTNSLMSSNLFSVAVSMAASIVV